MLTKSSHFPLRCRTLENFTSQEKSRDFFFHCLHESDDIEAPSIYDFKMLDEEPVRVHSLPTAAVKTFNQYTDEVFLAYLEQQLQIAPIVSVVWDEYISGSLKESIREKRGIGLRRKVSGDTKVP